MSAEHKSEHALSALFRRMRPRLLFTGRRLLGNEDDASDALQDTFLKLWKTHSEPCEALVVTAMRNTCIDSLRRRRPDNELSEDIAADTESTETAELYDEVTRLIQTALSERDRQILLLRDRDGYEFDAIAASTGLSEANVRVILSRARRTIREIYRRRNSL